MPRTALIAGATGLVGGECLRLLRDSRAYDRVIVVTRRPLGAAAAAPKVQEIVVDFAALESVKGLLVAHDVFCALGTTIKKAGSQAKFREVDFDYPKRLAELTLAAGARHFSLVSALGASAASNVFYSRVKGELEDAVRAMSWPGLSLLRPSVIAGDRQESRPIERLMEHTLRFAPRKWRPVPARDIAAAMIATALANRTGVTILESAAIPDVAARLRDA
jgi:uncharacterized protein YbjT (DUF2867 family)